jgi:hypothetical protein
MDASQRAADLIAVVVGRKVSHVWKGHGSTIYLELGVLTASTLTRKDGSSGNPSGEITIGVDGGWRIESEERIVCGSSSENIGVFSGVSKLVDRTICGIDFLGRLPELQISFSGGLYLASFMTAEGGPDWEIMDRRESVAWAMASEAGQIHIKECPIPAANQPLR